MTPEQISLVRSRARCLYDNRQMQAVLDDMAQRISQQLVHANPLVLCVMNGGLITTAGLLSRLDFPLQLDYIHATRYRDQTRGAELQWKALPGSSLRDRVVLVVDDILDEGVTLARILQWCGEQQARQTFSAVLVDKQHDRRQVELQADFTGLQVPDHYLFGFGMDYKGFLRNAPGIFAVHPDDLDA
ncbi:MAG: hypothetical protein RLZZ385_1412 [Pseudomonadota bacterium]|jgi:hypoxanthine phosphoribosyltransferase